ncbi:hypothetical protein GPX01_08870 [Streptococcus thermophilus]|nr:hypothetical protein [Streptococcus thermophilus]MCE2255891.1 hypothetical protein [Streptococcus thermophilus]MCE2265867.1 hypothetical protein [Streptococcus thermophilus]MCE2267441.1 hypothetical protein [Streptococcus thermophilus]MCE2274557.1 hypothetical protein [Streptococcus thermophilus]
MNELVTKGSLMSYHHFSMSLHRHRARASIRKHRHRGKTRHQTIQLQESKLNNRPR